MNEFMTAALPWLCIGITIALFAVNHGAPKKAKDSEKTQGSYMTEGMCLGMCVGVILNTAYMPYGMLVGMVIGMCIKKEYENT